MLVSRSLYNADALIRLLRRITLEAFGVKRK